MGNLMQLILMLLQNRAAAVIGVDDDAVDLLIDFGGYILGIISCMAEIAAEEYLIVPRAEGNRAKRFAHAVFGDHLARNLRGALNIVGRACRNVAEDQRFRHTAAQQDDELIEHIVFGGIALILLRHGHRIAARHTARNNGNLMDGILTRQEEGCHRVARLMVGGQFFLLAAHLMGLLLRADDDLNRRFLDLCHRDRLLIPACGKQCCFIQKILEVCARKSYGGARNDIQIDIRGQWFSLGMDLQDRLAALEIRIANRDLTVKPAGAQQRRVEDIRAVRRRNNDDALICAEAVHLNQQLVQRLLALIMPAAHAGAAMTADRVDLIDEDDRRRILFGLFKQIANTRRAHADIHLYEIRAGNREKRHVCLACHRTGQQRLTGAGRADEQYAFRDPGAQIVELTRLLEECNDFGKLFLFLVRARNVFKGGFALFVLNLLDARLTEAHCPVGFVGHRLIHAARHIDQAADQQHDHQRRRQKAYPPGIGAPRLHIVFNGSVRMRFIVIAHGLMNIFNEQICIGNRVFLPLIASFELVFQHTAA